MRRSFRLPHAICVDDIVPTLTVLQDDTPVRGNALASGDDTEDRKAEDEIIARLNDGDEWAWALVTVSVSALGFTGTDTLGACTYANEHAFRVGDYFRDMVKNAANDLAQQLHDAGFVLEKDGVR